MYYLCRRHSAKTWVSKNTNEPRKRQRISREAIACGMKFKAVIANDFVTATRTGECENHCHDLESQDRQKKNPGIKTLAVNQVSHGYSIAAVTANVTAKTRPKDRVILKELGGHWLNLNDVHNSAAAYKAANSDLRRIGARQAWKE